MSNTSKGRGEKGSKRLIQDIVNTNKGIKLTNEIKKLDNLIGDITWISPLEEENYEEYKLNSTKLARLNIQKKDMEFWPTNQPQWDAIGISDDKEEKLIIFVEAKAHINEMNASCSSKNEKNLQLIEKTLMDTHNNFALNNSKFDKNLWMGKYYQLGNRLAFLDKLTSKGYKVRLVLLNFLNDTTYIATTEKDWICHYDKVFEDMIGKSNKQNNVLVINI